MIMVLWWAQKHFPVAVKLAVEDGAEFPEAIDGLFALESSAAFDLLSKIGWSVDFITAFMYVSICTLGVLSNKKETAIYYTINKKYLAA